ncbi:HNH endonuclease [Burkholderia multivorans]|uniref:HNH endonuclease n=1 Tax=Burkholderia multivorans TaxID=87883 RepID=UPI002B24F241|nr:HNH endonuclease [Burkholderia multivorans]MEB2489285.1 HNH endonuclease [Burkholderia multivorans]MEB2571296.1 HNH endonuclease [Burkholderia multivorans]
MTQSENGGRLEQIKAALDFYGATYGLAGEWFLNVGEKIILKRRDGLRICRFCGLGDQDVEFRKEAHALPEAMGNKSLFSEYECDRCNEIFGSTIEDDFGNWSKPMRTLMRISGKKGVPSLRKGPNGGWRIDYKNSQLQVTAYESEPIFEVDEKNRRINFTLRRDAYTPIAVLKTLCKIALTVMPEDDVENYVDALAWLRQPHVSSPFSAIPVLRSFVPGPIPNDKIAIQLLRRKRDDIDVPYMFMVLMYGNEVYQVFLGSRTRDAHLNGKEGTFPFYPTPYDLVGNWPYGPIQRGPLHLSGAEVVRGDTCKMAMSFDQIIDNSKE